MKGTRSITRVARPPLPNDMEAEGLVLAAILLDRAALDHVLEILKVEHFYADVNRQIYEAFLALSEEGTPIDVISVGAYLRERQQHTDATGPYLAQLVNATPAIHRIADVALRVWEKWRLRQVIDVCEQAACYGYVDHGPTQKFIDGTEQALADLARPPTRAAVVTLRDLVKGTMDKLASNADRGITITGIPTGYEKLDAKIAGLHDGDLMIVAARPGVGKTSLATNIAVNVAAPRRFDWPVPGRPWVTFPFDASVYGVLVCSLEMPRIQLATRMVCTEGRVDLGKLRQNAITNEERERLYDAARFMAGLPLWVDDTPAITVLDLRAKVRRLQTDFDRPQTTERPAQRVGLVVVDYLQLMKGREGVSSREQEIGEISRGLKAMAKELKVPVIALSQLNRSGEGKGRAPTARPVLSALRESGSLEQDADTIIFIYRDEMHRPDSDAKGIAELIIAKQRNGATGTVHTRFTASCTRFDNLTSAEYVGPSEDD
jgi:replicative DNA helicase